MIKTLSLGDIATVHDKRRIPLNSRQRKERQGAIPYYGATGILDYVDEPLFDGEYVLIGEDGENLRSKKLDLAFKVSGQFWVNNHAHILEGNEPWINDYIVNFFRAVDISPYITGAAQPKLNQAALMRIPIYWPGEIEAKKIADILGTIDKKIELNRQMNDTLEQVGRALYYHYFIDNPDIKKWKAGKFSDIAHVLTGKGSTKSQLSENGIIPLYGANGVVGSSEHFLYNDPLVITGRVGTLGKVRVVTEPAWFSDNVLIMKPKITSLGFVYHTALTFDYSAMNRGSSQPLVTQTDLKNKNIMLPNEELLREFERQFSNILSQQQGNDKQILTLTGLRDTLLSRMIKGELQN